MLQLLAETRISEISLRYREQTVDSGTPYFAYGVTVLIAAIAAVAILRWLKHKGPIAPTPHGMLVELCQRHRISAGGRRLLEKAAQRAGLDHPGTMFLTMARFDQVLERASSQSPFSRRQRATLEVLRRRMFASEPIPVSRRNK